MRRDPARPRRAPRPRKPGGAAAGAASPNGPGAREEAGRDGAAVEAGAAIEPHVEAILRALGEDPGREGLVRTPLRVAKSLRALTAGYAQRPEEILRGATFASDTDEMVLVKDIEVYSLCEHHLLPFFGRAHVAYLPAGRIVGLSKLARVVDAFAHRLQVQEHLTQQIADALNRALDPLGVGVLIEAQHLCMMMRGVSKQNSLAVTSCMLGRFRSDAKTRHEFLELVRRPAPR